MSLDLLPPHLQVIGEEWRRRAPDLANWAWDRLVNRKDVWGQYTKMSERERRESKRGYKALTLPQKKMRGKDMVTDDKLNRHFGSLKRFHLIGLHSKSAENTCRWFAIDIDLHDPDAAEAEDCARRNFAAALGWWEALQQQGYDPLLLDSNGAGGFHLWTLLAEPAPAADVFGFADELVSDWEKRNLDAQPETYPKSAKLEGEKLGAWLRVPGLHHTRDHFTKVWSGEDWLDDPWLEGEAAIEMLLAATPGPPPPTVEVKDPHLQPAPKQKVAKKKRSRKRLTVCVDLDGVLSNYGGWKGIEHFGEPIPGAVDFTKDLSRRYRIVIFTSRCHEEEGRDVDYARKLVTAWLDRHGFAYDEIYTGNGKPFANAYIDDRAVSCRPQEDGGEAFAQALEGVEKLSR